MTATIWHRHDKTAVLKNEEGFFFSYSKLPIFICHTICVDAWNVNLVEDHVMYVIDVGAKKLTQQCNAGKLNSTLLLQNHSMYVICISSYEYYAFKRDFPPRMTWISLNARSLSDDVLKALKLNWSREKCHRLAFLWELTTGSIRVVSSNLSVISALPRRLQVMVMNNQTFRNVWRCYSMMLLSTANDRGAVDVWVVREVA